MVTGCHVKYLAGCQIMHLAEHQGLVAVALVGCSTCDGVSERPKNTSEIQ